MLVFLAVASLPLSRVRLKFILELRLVCLVEFVAVVCYHRSSGLLACGLPSSPVPSQLPVPSRAPRSTFLSPPYRFPFSSRAIRPMFAPHPCHFAASSLAFRPTLPFVRLVSRCVVRYSFGVSSCPYRLPSCPVSRFLCTVLSFFRRVLLYSTNIFALWRFARQTVTLGFGITHLYCAVVCVCTLY